MSPRPLLLVCALAAASAFFTQARAEVRPVPPPGVAVPEPDRKELEAGIAALGGEIDALRKSGKPEISALLPDVMIFHKAADWALRYGEFFDVKEIAKAKAQLALGMQRAKELREGKPSWTTATGLVVRGYISKIDGSVQPYGLVIPDDWKPADAPRRLDLWCHGRGEKLSELNFLEDRMHNKGDYTPPGAFVLHLYGRYCCANKFAGEVDLFEALANAKTHYAIDDKRLVVRGFSMGGASAWQFGTHFAGMWAAVQPGAGFGESKEFLHLDTPEKLPPPWEQTLWRWYDSTGYVSNLANTTTVAYSGEIDGQKQAADIMIRYARQEAGNAHPPVAEPGKVAPGDGSPKAEEARVTDTAPDLALYHIIAPKTAHKVIAEEKPEVEKLVGAAVEKHVAMPKKVHLTTYSLIYPRQDWVTVTGMDKEWERADVEAELSGSGDITAKTSNVDGLQILMPPAAPDVGRITIDGLVVSEKAGTRGVTLRRDGGKWKLVGPFPGTAKTLPASGKNVDLCGPIDHAFMSPFLFVRSTGKAANPEVGAWADAELKHAMEFWRKVFRGEAPVKDDTALTKEDIAEKNLIVFGDPASSKVLQSMATLGVRDGGHSGDPLGLPYQWSGDKLLFGGKSYDAKTHVPLLIFPNPLNPRKYIVLNSGVTFREQALLNNADQTPKLPDWAIIDITTPPDAKSPGKVVDAGFFNETWHLPLR